MRRSGMSSLRAGLLAVAAIAAVCYVIFFGLDFLSKGFELRAAFTSSGELRPDSPVRIAGIEVGKVTRIERLGADDALVTMELSEHALPIHADARAKLRPRLFLEGNFFVDLESGSPSSPRLGDGDTIPISQTAVPVGIGDFLGIFTRDTREDVRTILQELGKAYDGPGGSGFNRSIRYQEPAFRDGARAADATRGLFERDLSGFIDGAGRVAAALDRDPRALRGTVRGLATTSEALAVDTVALRSLVAQLDETLVDGRRALVALDEATPALRRLIDDLRPAVRSSGPALEASLPLVAQLRALVSPAELQGLARELRPLVPRLVQLNRGGLPLQEQARALSSCQLQTVIPTLSSKLSDPLEPASGPVHEEAAKALVGFAGESRGFDANGQFTKSLAQTANYAYPLGDGRFFFTTSPLQGVNPPKQAQSPYEPGVPCETQERPDLATVPAPPPPSIRVDHGSPAARAAAARALPRTVRWLRRTLRRQGLSKRFSVSAEPLTRGQIPGLDGR